MNNYPPNIVTKATGSGDVGLVTEDGRFSVFFNICLPSTHPLHSTYGVPEDFKQIVLSPLDTLRLESANYPGSVVVTQSIIKTNLTIKTSGGSTSATLSIQGGLSIQLDSTVTEGAVLVLPEGSRQETLKILQRQH
ncbi:hypothetical protein EDC04DRAFT_2937703 [Pisolithus marmoratus]|nr:hypothetical protein EDC04DRAFT_2937703 [Pisolithus marmoratus]